VKIKAGSGNKKRAYGDVTINAFKTSFITSLSKIKLWNASAPLKVIGRYKILSRQEAVSESECIFRPVAAALELNVIHGALLCICRRHCFRFQLLYTFILYYNINGKGERCAFNFWLRSSDDVWMTIAGGVLKVDFQIKVGRQQSREISQEQALASVKRDARVVILQALLAKIRARHELFMAHARRALIFLLCSRETGKSNLIIICENVHVESASEWVTISDDAQDVPELVVLRVRVKTLVWVSQDSRFVRSSLASEDACVETPML
jgi:hypothetical protein